MTAVAWTVARMCGRVPPAAPPYSWTPAPARAGTCPGSISGRPPDFHWHRPPATNVQWHARIAAGTARDPDASAPASAPCPFVSRRSRTRRPRPAAEPQGAAGHRCDAAGDARSRAATRHYSGFLVPADAGDLGGPGALGRDAAGGA